MPEIWFPNLGIVIDKLSRTAATFGNFNLYWYGIFIGLGIVCAVLYVMHEASRTGQSVDEYLDFGVWAIILSIIGARVYYVIFKLDYYMENPMKIFAFREGGLAIYGAVITGILCGVVYCIRKKKNIYLRTAKKILCMIKKIFISVGEYLLFMKMVFRKPEKWRIFWRQFVNESDKLIISSILLVGVISVFIGGVLVIQTASNLENPIIDKMYIGYMVRESLVLEF